MRWVLVGALLTAWIGCSKERQEISEINVFAAASLVDVLTDMETLFERTNPHQRIVLNVAATSLLARQIEYGAPADLFVSANMSWMDYLTERGRIEGVSVPLTGNRLTVVGPAGIAPLENWNEILNFASIAMADPSHVPAGLYAREALECANLWEATAPQIIPMLNVRTALLSISTGAAEIAIVYASDVHKASDLTVLLEWPESCAPSIHYLAAAVKEGPNPTGATAFLEFITDPQYASLWQWHGFTEQAP